MFIVFIKTYTFRVFCTSEMQLRSTIESNYYQFRAASELGMCFTNCEITIVTSCELTSFDLQDTLDTSQVASSTSPHSQSEITGQRSRFKPFRFRKELKNSSANNSQQCNPILKYLQLNIMRLFKCRASKPKLVLWSSYFSSFFYYYSYYVPQL